MASWGENNGNIEKPVYKSFYSRAGGGYHQNSRFAGENAKIILVDSNKLGAVIGKGGSNVKKFEQDSGAKICIERKEKRGDETKIEIKGSNDQIEEASRMIEDCVRNFQTRGGTESAGYGYNRSDRNNSNNHWSSNNSSQQSYCNRNNDSQNQRNSDYSGSKTSTYSDHHESFQNRWNSDSNRGRFSNDGNRHSEYINKRDRNDHDHCNSKSRNDHDDSQSRYSKNKSENHYQSDEIEKEDDFVPIDWDNVYAQADRSAAEQLASLPKIVKQTYHEDPQIAIMSPLDVAEFRLKNMNISVTRIFAEKEEENISIPNPIKTFEQAFNGYPEILETIYKQEFKSPSPIQSQAWPVIMSGEDLIGIAQTGTGKTLAFLLPAFIHVEAQPVPRSERSGPTVLILSPTRELACQIEKEINKYSYKAIKCVCTYGGGCRRTQIMSLKRDKPEIVVATPGRLDDLVGGAELELDSVTYIVLDEADKMLEMGFECQIRKILINVRQDRQSIMTSATWPPAVRRLASQYSVNPVQVVVGSLDLAAVHSVTQEIKIVDEDNKREELREFLRNMDPDDKVIVFCGKKIVTDDITSNLILEGVKCQSLHGDREQCDREQALNDLKTGEVHILIATDVAARGIDVVDITHVFNYDFPKNIEEYVHRIGRTGRAGRTGHSISLFTRRDWANAADLIKILEEANQGVPEELIDMAQRFDARKRRDDMDRRQGRGGGNRRGVGGFRSGRDRY